MPSACSPFRKAPHHPIYLPYSPTQSTGFGFSSCRTGIIPSTDAHRAHYLWRLDKDWLNQRLIDCPIRPIFRRRAKPNPNETHRDNKRKAPFLMCKAEHKKKQTPLPPLKGGINILLSSRGKIDAIKQYSEIKRNK